MQATPYGFRIVGSCRETRRLVDADAAFSGYAACDEQAEVNTEAYLSAFQFGEDFRRHLEMTGSTKGYTGPCWSPWLWWDIDRETDIEAATKDARRLAAFLADRYRIDGDELLIFYSGSKGYHVGLPTSLWQSEPTAVFNKLARRLAEYVAELLGIDIDAGVYDKVRAFRAPNSRHPKTGRHKRRLAFDELLRVKTAALLDSATEPQPFDLPLPPSVDDKAVIDWRKAGEQVAESTTANRQRRLTFNGSPKLNRQTIEFISDGASTGDRHRLLFSAAANLAEFDCPSSLAQALLTESALDSGLTPNDTRRQIECGLSSVSSEATQQESCNGPVFKNTRECDTAEPERSQEGALRANDSSDKMSRSNYQTAADVFDGWRDDVLTGEPPTLYPVGTGELARIEVGPRLITLIGGPPGAGKTAFTMQCVVDALRLTNTLRVLVCNIEMPPAVLLDRQLARLSGIDAATIRSRKLGAAHSDRLDKAMNTLEHVAERLCFVRPPFNLTNAAAAAEAFDAGLLVLDYIQRIPPPGEYGDRRGSVDATMNYLRQFADTGIGIVVVAAVARQKDNRGRSSYAGESLSLASFRDSSELEFGADDAFILSPSPKAADSVLLRHLKARHTEPHDMTLHFDRKRQLFTPATSAAKPQQNGRFQSALATLWDQTEPASESKMGDDFE